MNRNGKLKAGIAGATGMVGQRFITLLKDHPLFEISSLSASPRSCGKTYTDALQDRWKMNSPIPDAAARLVIKDASDIEAIASEVDFIFCAVDMAKDDIAALEENYAKHGIPVISNNSAHRKTPDVPMIIPEINPDHSAVIQEQRKRLGTDNGFIAVKPNCSIQSYVPALHALKDFRPTEIAVSTYQAISGAGKTFETWPDMKDNVIPYIAGEEEKSEKEPLKIWGNIFNGTIKAADTPIITAQCIRVPVSDGHLASVFVNFAVKPTPEQIINAWNNFTCSTIASGLPSAPEKFINYMNEPDRPQTSLDRDFENGMGISIGRLREDALFDYKFVCLSHNTLRGAAGGAVLTAELLVKQGYIKSKT